MFPILISDGASRQALPDGEKPVARDAAFPDEDGFMSEFSPTEETIVPIAWQGVQANQPAGMPAFVYGRFLTPPDLGGEASGEVVSDAEVESAVADAKPAMSDDPEIPLPRASGIKRLLTADSGPLVAVAAHPPPVRMAFGADVAPPDEPASNRVELVVPSARMAPVQTGAGRAEVTAAVARKDAQPIENIAQVMTAQSGHAHENTAQPDSNLGAARLTPSPGAVGNFTHEEVDPTGGRSPENSKNTFAHTHPVKVPLQATDVTENDPEAAAQLPAPSRGTPRAGQDDLPAGRSPVADRPATVEVLAVRAERGDHESQLPPKNEVMRPEREPAPGAAVPQPSERAFERASDNARFHSVQREAPPALDEPALSGAQAGPPEGKRQEAKAPMDGARPHILPDHAAIVAGPPSQETSRTNVGARQAIADRDTALGQQASPEKAQEISLADPIRAEISSVPPPVSGSITSTHTQAASTITPHTPLGSSVAAQVAVVISEMDAGQIEISLSPEELGKVRLTLQPLESGLMVGLHADRPETLDLMRRHVHVLARDLAELGYDAVAFDFGGGQSDQGAFFTGAEPARPEAADESAGPKTEELSISHHPRLSSLEMGTDSGLDIRI
ncbi:flagellar hook-length control protein FliK [Thioclava sp. A2]|uniref:flagellar hook-length control protein FliK n=1 Tax=Thioclava sp. FCG-A2 TaxID=3080562 RepID=UPI002953FADB|nr:flagellar hook-length control protein FliK [Thioclava sp. A2]MDV7270676.1 flagellar hook-length control protein FliK [Thioclava sp. A2]